MLMVFVAFALIFLAFDNSKNFGDHILTSYLAIYGPPDMSDSSSAQIIYFSLYAFILGIVLNNLLVAIIGKSQETMFEKISEVEAKEQLDLNAESMDFHDSTLILIFKSTAKLKRYLLLFIKMHDYH